MQFTSTNQYGREAFRRPYGKVQLMLEMASKSLHCTICMEAGKLCLNKSVFYPGSVINGCSNISCQTNQGDESGTGRIEEGSNGKNGEPKERPDPKERRLCHTSVNNSVSRGSRSGAAPSKNFHHMPVYFLYKFDHT